MAVAPKRATIGKILLGAKYMRRSNNEIKPSEETSLMAQGSVPAKNYSRELLRNLMDSCATLCNINNLAYTEIQLIKKPAIKRQLGILKLSVGNVNVLMPQTVCDSAEPQLDSLSWL